MFGLKRLGRPDAKRAALQPDAEGLKSGLQTESSIAKDELNDVEQAELQRQKAAEVAATEEKETAQRAERLALIEAEKKAQELREAEIRERSKWDYSEHSDEMRGASISLAQLVSNDGVDLPFPWAGGSQGIISIRKTGPRRDVIFSVTKGQFYGTIHGYLVSTKSDTRAIETWKGSKPDNQSLTTMFLTHPEAFIRTVSAAKRFIVEVEFYRVGRKQYVFSPEGLDIRFLR